MCEGDEPIHVVNAQGAMLCVTTGTGNVQTQPRAPSIVGVELHHRAVPGQLELPFVKKPSSVRRAWRGENNTPHVFAFNDLAMWAWSGTWRSMEAPLRARFRALVRTCENWPTPQKNGCAPGKHASKQDTESHPSSCFEFLLCLKTLASWRMSQ